MKKEIIIFIIVFIILALGQHPDLLSTPLERLSQLPTAGAYGIGAVHPIIFSFIGYLIVGVFRLIYKGIVKLFTKSND